MYIGVNNMAKKVANAYIGINGEAKAISKIYIGDSNGKAKLAWENYSPYEPIPYDLEFNRLNTAILNKTNENYIDYLVPETNWYQIELISPFTQSENSLNNKLTSGKIEYGFDNNLSNENEENINYIDLTGMTDYASGTIKASKCPSNASVKQMQIRVKDLSGPDLGRGSSYGIKTLKLKKGMIVRFIWIDYGYTNILSSQTWGKQLKVIFLNQSKIEDMWFYSDINNTHNFSGISELDLSPYNSDDSIQLSTYDVLEEDENGIINLKINSTRSKFYGITNYLEDKFETLNSTNKIYGIYNTSNSVINSKKCQELGLGASQEENGVGSASIYFNLDFTSDWKSVQFKAGQSLEITGEIFPGCFCITPATIKNN